VGEASVPSGPLFPLKLGLRTGIEEHPHVGAELAGRSPFHFSRVFKQATGMTPIQFLTRERMLQAQQLIRETSRSLIEIALEVGYTSPSHFAQVFRRTVGMAPTQFRNALLE